MRKLPSVKFHFAAIFFLIFLSSFQLYGQQPGRSTISGFVFGNNRTPVGDTIVELLNELGVTVSRYRTQSDGRYFFSGLSHGRFAVRVRPFMTSYQETTVDVEIAGSGLNGRLLTDNVQRDVFLRPVKNAEAIPFQNTVIFAQEVPIEAEKLYKSGIKDLSDGKLDAGETKLKQSLLIFPTYFASLQQLGVVFMNQKKFAEAAIIFDNAVKVNDRSLDCWYGLGYSYLSMSDATQAITAINKAISIQPNSAEAHLLLGMSQRINKEYKISEASMLKAASLAEGRLPDIYWNLALLYAYNLKESSKAADQLETYLKTMPNASNKNDIKKLIKKFREQK